MIIVLKTWEKKKPPVTDRGQVNREASRLGDAGAIDPLPTPEGRNTGGTAAVFDGCIVWCAAKVAIRKKPDAAMLVCSLGAVANIGIANTLYETHTSWSIAGAIGAVIGVVWNYAVSATLVWRAR